MNEDFSEILNKFSEILKEKNIDMNSIVTDEASSGASSDCNEKGTSNDFSLDIDTIMKIKNIITKMNSYKNSPRNHLLYSLKPYLENEKKEKLDKYIQIANLLNVMENMDLGINFLKDNKKGYDFILIITLVLLII